MGTQSLRDALVRLNEAQLSSTFTAGTPTGFSEHYGLSTEIYNRQFAKRFKGIPEETLLKLAQEHFPEYFI